jgi:hypothetical protein
MAARGSSSRRIPGNPLGGILRDTQRANRAVTGPRSGGAATVYAATLLTDTFGKVSAVFPVPFLEPPVVQLTTGPGLDGVLIPMIATVAEVTPLGMSLVVWTLAGAAAPSGVAVHATAYERT